MKAKGTTILLSSHILRELESHCDRIMILQGGEMAALGSLQQLRHHAQIPVIIRITTNGPSDVLIARLSPLTPIHTVQDRVVQLECPLANKVSLLNRISQDGANVQDIEIKHPNLEDIYLHFSRNTSGETA